MATKTVRELIDGLVSELDDLIEGRVSELLTARLQTVVETIGGKESFGNKPMAVRNTKKRARKSFQRPCPVPKCKELAFPRFHQLCKKHDGKLSLEEGDVLRMKAQRPGGKWYVLGIGKYAAKDAKKNGSSAAKPAAKKPSVRIRRRKPVAAVAAGGEEEF